MATNSVKAAAETAVATMSASTAVRRILVENGNAPMRLPVVWSVMQAKYPDLVTSKTSFKRDVVMQMVKRGQIVSAKIAEDRKGRIVQHYGMRLKNNRSNRTLVAAEGSILPRYRTAPVAAPAAAVPQAEQMA